MSDSRFRPRPLGEWAAALRRVRVKATRAVTPSTEALLRKPLKELSDELDPTVFWQIHRATIVNLNAIGSVAHDAYGHLILKLKQRKEVLRVSEPYAHLFRQM